MDALPAIEQRSSIRSSSSPRRRATVHYTVHYPNLYSAGIAKGDVRGSLWFYRHLVDETVLVLFARTLNRFCATFDSISSIVPQRGECSSSILWLTHI